jgi:hypothetical protein
VPRSAQRAERHPACPSRGAPALPVAVLHGAEFGNLTRSGDFPGEDRTESRQAMNITDLLNPSARLPGRDAA